jgi:glycosyltransferase involved in cell wall biosynthesis
VVHGLCPVTRDHVLRSGGGLYFSSADDFFAVIDRLITDEPLSRALGVSGRAYVDSEYSWGAVIKRFYDTVEALFGREAPVFEGL